MAAIDTFKWLDAQVTEVLARNSDYAAIVAEVRPFLEELLQSETLVPQEYLEPKPDKYAQYLLYKPENESFAVIAFVWGVGQVAPIHDHLIWGLVGVWQGAVEEDRYRRIDNGEHAEQRYSLEKVKTVKAEKGDISFVYPPDYDIHGVSNPYDEPAVTIHIYGTDIGQQQRHIHHPENGTLRDVITRHDNAAPIYST